MNTIIVHPKTEAEQNAIQAFLEGLDVDFETAFYEEEDSCELPAHVIEGIKKSEQEIREGKFYTHEEVMKEFKHYL